MNPFHSAVEFHPDSATMLPTLIEEAAVSPQKESGECLLAADQAYQALRTGIINLAYPPGSLLKDTELMETFQLGRTPIREAIKKLEVELLVITKPRQGTYVAEISLADFAQQHPIFRQLTVLAVGLAVQQRSPKKLHQLKLQHRMLEVHELGPAESLLRALLEFHRRLGWVAGNLYLGQMVSRYCGYIQRVWLLVASQLGDYTDLMAFLEAGKADAAQQLMHSHLDIVHRRVLKKLSQ